MSTATNSRKVLWLQTTHECILLLELAARAEATASTPEAIDAAILGRDVPFGHALDCHATSRASRMLAIVLFCQLRKAGRPDGNVVAANQAMQAHWDATVKAAFPAPGEAEAFEHFYSSLVALRDNVLGHANGAWFNFQHDPARISFKGYSAALLEIDITYFLSCAERLRGTLLGKDGLR